MTKTTSGYYQSLKGYKVEVLRLLGRNANIANWQKMKKVELIEALWNNYLNK